jgi:hypothetical protein
MFAARLAGRRPVVIVLRRTLLRRAGVPRGSAGRSRLIAGRTRDRRANQLFDRAQQRSLISTAVGNRDPVRAGTPGSADPVHIALGLIRQFEIDHMADAIDIDAASRDVGRDQRAYGAVAKPRQSALPIVL